MMYDMMIKRGAPPKPDQRFKRLRSGHLACNMANATGCCCHCMSIARTDDAGAEGNKACRMTYLYGTTYSTLPHLIVG